MKRIPTLFLVLSILFCSCSSNTPTPTLTPTIVTPTATLTPTLVTPTATATPIPTFTPTRQPTPTPTLTPTPIPFVWERLTLAEFLPRDPITAVAIDPQDPNVIYVGTENTGLYKSIDSGLSWFPVQESIDIAQVRSLVIDPQNPQILYAATSQFGLYKSVDGGAHWRLMNSGILQQGGRDIGFVVLDGTSNQHLFYVTENLIHESRDGAQSWTLIKPIGTCPRQIFTPTSLIVDPSNSNLIYASHWDVPHCQGGVYKSVDGGRRWTLTNLRAAGIQGIFVERMPDQYFVYAYVSWNDRRLVVSPDEGNSWQRLPYTCSLMVPHPQGGMLAYCDRSIRRISNGGADGAYLGWSPISDVRAIAISSANPNVIVLGGESLYISYDGGQTWQERTHGLSAHRFEVRVHPGASAVLYAFSWTGRNFRDHPLYVSHNTGVTWRLLIREGNGLQFDADGRTLYRHGRVLSRSQDDGRTWQTLPLPELPDRWGQGSSVPFSRIFTHPSNSQTLYFVGNTFESLKPAGGQLYISNDAGASWRLLSEIRNNIGLYTSSLFFDNTGKLTYLVPFFQAYRSENDGANWTQCGDRSIEWSSLSDSRLVIDPRNNRRILVSSLGKGVLGSQNGCDTWVSRNTGLRTRSVSTLSIDPRNADLVYASTDFGAYISFDFGGHWHEINAGLLGSKVVYSITVDKDGNVYAATPYGIYLLRR